VNNTSDRELEKIESEWISNPTPMLCARLADMFRQAGRLDESREIATSGLKKWKNNASIEIVLGKCYRDSGLLEKALETFESVHSLQPQNLVALRNLAEIYFRKENWSEAINSYEDYLFEHPGDEEARDRLEEAKAQRDSPPIDGLEFEEDSTAEEESNVFPDTDRMNRVLEAQGIASEAVQNDQGEELDEEEDEALLEEEPSEQDLPGKELFSERVSPGSLLGFFSEEEREDLNLRQYNGEGE
jgi:tetratricopeptide (TPR) repeat protein